MKHNYDRSLRVKGYALVTHSLFLTCLIWCSVVDVTGATPRVQVTWCGGYVNGSSGFIQTPDFPRRFPVPISCQWLIHAPPGKKIVIYFTQYYMRESFKLTEFDYYEGPHNFHGKHDLGEISFEEEVTSFTVYKPFLLLRFQVEEIGNIHLRVFDFLLDVYGFNITYEIVDRNAPVREDACSVFKCSFLGNCLAQRNFETYKCHCFHDFFGDDCQYGPYCNPDKDINMCKNGGKCRYFFGSLVNTCECPPGYYGVQCEKKREDYVNSICETMGCNQKCIKEYDSFRCSCEEGYRLKDNNKTCIEKGRMRYNSKMRCKMGAEHEPVTNETLFTACPQYRENFTQLIRSLLAPQLKEFQNFTILDISLGEAGYFYTDFIFMGEEADNVEIWNALYEIVKTADLCACVMDGDYLYFDSEPALHMMSLQDFDNRPVVAGQLLTLICRAKGSDGLRFEWFKDAAPVNVHWTTRNMWETNIPSSDGESRMSVLNIDHAHYLDAGIYACKVTDWNETKTKQVVVTVINPPHVEVTPLAVTVMEGQTTNCKCLSSDDDRGEFTYQWKKGGELLEASDKQTDEVIEDLYPTGSRLTVHAKKTTQVYTCAITAPSGEAQESCRINVAKVAMSVRSCPEETYFGVSWQQTSENGTDIQRCPRNEKAKASRTCQCSSTVGCVWQEANFAKCTSPALQLIKDELTKLQLGYVATDVATVVAALQQFLRTQDTAKAFMGDVELATMVLYGSHVFLRTYYREDEPRPTILDFIKTASVIIQRGRKGSEEERAAVAVGVFMLKLADSLRQDARVTLIKSVTSSSMATRSVDLHIARIQELGLRDTVQIYNGRYARVSLPVSGQNAQSSRKRRIPGPQVPWKPVFVTMVFEGLQDLIQNTSLRLRQVLNSHIVSVGPHVPRLAAADSQKDEHPLLVDIQFTHYARTVPQEIPNITSCLHWQMARAGEPGGQWTSGRCTVLEIDPRFTRCRCRTPGHFALVTLTELTRMQVRSEKRLNTITLTGCVISLVGFVSAGLIKIYFWGQMKDNDKVVAINFCVAAIALNCVLISGISGPETEILCRVVMLMITVLYLVALSFLVIDAFHQLYGRLKRSMKLSAIKATLCGWGFPVLVLIATLGCGELIGYSPLGGRYCWLSVGTWEMYAFIAPASILLVSYLLLLARLVQEATCQNQTPPKKERQKYILYTCHSAMMLSFLTLACVMNVIMVNNTLSVFPILFTIAIAAMGVFFLLLHCACVLALKRYHDVMAACLVRVQTTIFGASTTQIPTSQSSGAFKAFLRPTSNQSTGDSTGPARSGEGEEIHLEDPQMRGKVNYTTELRALLGSSSDSASSNKESDVAPNPSGMRVQLTNGKGKGYSSSRRNNRNEYVADNRGAAVSVRPARGQSFILTESDDNMLSNQTAKEVASKSACGSYASSTSSDSVPNPFPGLKESGESLSDSMNSGLPSTEERGNETLADNLEPVKSYVLLEYDSKLCPPGDRHVSALYIDL